MSLPILIKPRSFEWGFFYYFRFAMKISFKITQILFLFCFYSSFVFSQENDSLEVSNSKYDSILYSNTYFLDILFYKHHNDVLINNLGPFGSTYYYPTVKGLFSKNDLLRLEKKVYQKRLQTLKGIKPFTNISYVNASRKEQLLSLSHVQQFGKSLSFAFTYKRISSPGIYINQEANNSLFNTFLNYKTKNQVYNFSLVANVTRTFLEENGGLKNYSVFENNLLNDRKTFEVNLLTSKVSEKKYHYQLKQKVRLWLNKIDSSRYSSLDMKLNTSYADRKRVFNDNDPLSLIYNDVFIDSLSTTDSIYMTTLSNKLFFIFSEGKVSFDVYGLHELENYYQSFGLDTSYQNFYLGSLFKFSQNKFMIDLDGRYAFNGYNKRDIDIDSKISYKFNKTFEVKADLAYHLNEPSLKYVNYESNHFSWTNYSFEKMGVLSSSVTFNLKKIKALLTFENKLLNNTLYYNNQAIAAQAKANQMISSIHASKNYRLLNFYFRSALIYQSTTDRSIFPLPELIGRQVFYYQNFLFKKALKFQLGFNVSYTSNYYGYAYTPATSEFYVQRDKRIGDYPYFDVFFNTQLKRAQIFLKYEHFNAGWSGYHYYSTVGYPTLDRSFKFGISWNMFD